MASDNHSEDSEKEPDDNTSPDSFGGAKKPASGGRLQEHGAGAAEDPLSASESVEERVFFWIRLLVVGLIVIGGIWIFTVLVLSDGAGGSNEDVAEPIVNVASPSTTSVELLLIPERLREEFLDMNGGENYLRDLKSIRVNGMIKTGDSERPFLLVKRNPGQSLLKTESDSGMVSVGTEGRVAWRALQRDSVYQTVYFLSGEPRDGALRASRFFDGLMDHFLSDRGRLEEVSLIDLDGEEAVEVVVSFEDGPNTRYLIDPTRLVVIKAIKEQDGVMTEQTFSDFRAVGFLQQPFLQETRIDGELVSTLVIESAELNVGIHPLLFKRPATTAPGRLQGGWSMEDYERERLSGESDARL